MRKKLAILAMVALITLVVATPALARRGGSGGSGGGGRQQLFTLVGTITAIGNDTITVQTLNDRFAGLGICLFLLGRAKLEQPSATMAEVDIDTERVDDAPYWGGSPCRNLSAVDAMHCRFGFCRPTHG
ncbi:MAG: hypothetical protein ISS49_09060 [Anaerolineae bacterium]|nr:hypothetical protein [Anaerolineae bacterium]